MNRATGTVKISVVIPALNEEKLLPLCLRSLKNQKFDHPYEIIVVDNNSRDQTSQVALAMGAKVEFEPHQSLTWARQKGLEAAQGEIIAFVDADTIVKEDWLQQIYHTLNQNQEVIAVSGKILYIKSNNWKGKLPRYFVTATRYSDTILRFLVRKTGSLWGGSFAVRKAALIKAGGFNKNIVFYGEDAELSLRLRQVGKIKFNKNLVAYTSPRRFESQGILKTEWAYVSNFIGVLLFNRYSAKRKKPRFPTFKIFSRKVLYSFTTLFMVIASIFFAFNPSSQFYGKVYSAGLNQQEKLIALSFDDGPNEPWTSQILKILDENDIRATFFLIGKNVEYYPNVVQKIVKRGHIVGNHTFSHSYLLPFEREKQIQKDILQTENIIYGLTGLRTNLFRPPHGLRTPWFLSDIKKLRYNIITWNDMTDDYDRGESAQEISKNIIKHAHPGGIIDLHDGVNLKHGVDRSNSLKALLLIIDQLKKRGYKFVTLPELLNIKPYK